MPTQHFPITAIGSLISGRAGIFPASLRASCQYAGFAVFNPVVILTNDSVQAGALGLDVGVSAGLLAR
jgi:hypothetical protein